MSVPAHAPVMLMCSYLHECLRFPAALHIVPDLASQHPVSHTDDLLLVVHRKAFTTGHDLSASQACQQHYHEHHLHSAPQSHHILRSACCSDDMVPARI